MYLYQQGRTNPWAFPLYRQVLLWWNRWIVLLNTWYLRYCLQNCYLRTPARKDGASSPSPRRANGSEKENIHTRQTLPRKDVVVIVVVWRRLPTAVARWWRASATARTTAAPTVRAPALNHCDRHFGPPTVVLRTAENHQNGRPGDQQHAVVPGTSSSGARTGRHVRCVAYQEEEVQDGRKAARQTS